MTRRVLVCCLTALGLTGCLHPVAEQTDHAVCTIAARPFDVHPLLEGASTYSMPLTEEKAGQANAPDEKRAAREEDEKKGGLGQRLRVPAELPGAGAPRTQLPPSTAPAREREAAIDQLFP